MRFATNSGVLVRRRESSTFAGDSTAKTITAKRTDAIEGMFREPAGVTAESGDWIVGDERVPPRQATLARQTHIGSRSTLAADARQPFV